MFTTLHLFLIWRIYLSVLVTCYAYIVYNTHIQCKRRVLAACFEKNLNQNLSKYIAVTEESYPFLIRDKSNIDVFIQSAESKCTFVRS